MGEIDISVSKSKKKKWGKEEWIILSLVGVFLVIVFFPSSGSKKVQERKTEIPESASQKTEMKTNDDYKAQMEKQLEEVLKSIDGIDSIHTMITLKNSEEEVILKENTHTRENTTEEDSQGGTREILSESEAETVCYKESGGEKTGPYVTYTIAPKVEGVLVVVGGEKAGLLRTQIVKAVQALFDVESHKVLVIKMKESYR